MSCSQCSIGKTSRGLEDCVEICQEGSVFKEGNCEKCGPGRYSSVLDESCVECIPGFFSSFDMNSKCMPCEIGKYSNSSGRTSCSSCPRNAMTSSASSTMLSNCLCAPGYYGNAYVGDECQQCNTREEFSCELNSTYPRISSGFFRSPDDPNFAYSCIPAEACLKTDKDQRFTTCSQGYTGFICGQCLSMEYYKSGALCSPCSSSLWSILILVAVGFILAAMGYLIVMKGFNSSTDLKILLFWVQIISFFPQVSSSWPSYISKLFQIISFTNLDIQIFSPGKFI